MGRLATYKYYNMDQIVAQALTEYSKIVGMSRKEAGMVTVDPRIPQVPLAPVHHLHNGNGNGSHKVLSNS